MAIAELEAERKAADKGLELRRVWNEHRSSARLWSVGTVQ